MTRLFDIIFSGLAIIVLSPLMLPIMIGLKLTGEHYIFYLQPRIGKRGKEFLVFKFATMLKDSPNLPGGVLTQKDDPRILPMGKFLRTTKINELPQLINILFGQMSIVGPRPLARRHYELYSPAVRSEIEKITPGLTGIGSVVFRDEESILNSAGGDRKLFHDTVIAPYKGELEVWYARHRNLDTYFALILLTVLSLFFPRNTLYRKCFSDLPVPPENLKKLLESNNQ